MACKQLGLGVFSVNSVETLMGRVCQALHSPLSQNYKVIGIPFLDIPIGRFIPNLLFS